MEKGLFCLSLILHFFLITKTFCQPFELVDTTFGTDGFTIHDVGSINDYMHAIAVQSDDKILVAGSMAGQSNSVIARFTESGMIDTSFGTSGQVLIDMHADRKDELVDLVILPDNSILAVGWYNAESLNDAPAVAKLTSEGVLDPGFGEGGIFKMEFAAADRGTAIHVSSRMPPS